MEFSYKSKIFSGSTTLSKRLDFDNKTVIESTIDLKIQNAGLLNIFNLRGSQRSSIFRKNVQGILNIEMPNRTGFFETNEKNYLLQTSPDEWLILSDSIDIPLSFSWENTFTVEITTLPDSVNSLKLWGEHILDWGGNNFADSVKTVPIRRTPAPEKIIGGNILGNVNYKGNLPIRIKADKIDGSEFYFADVENLKFKLENLSSGLYEIWGYESVESIDIAVYFSGTWSPFQRAARFTLYPDTIDVRTRWDVEGININFE